jgi:hypothetical protein
MDGLGDDDHTQYILHNLGDNEQDFLIYGEGSYSAQTKAEVAVILETVLDHGSIQGLGDDDHSVYILADGTRALSADWDAGAHTIRCDTIHATSGTGLRLVDDSDTLGLWVQDGGVVFIGNPVGNTNMTQGLTINQGTNDDEILAFKSSGDVLHGMTDITQTNIYATFKKIEGDTGGLQITALRETSDAAALWLLGVATDTDYTKSTAGIAPIILDAAVRSGTGKTSVGGEADGNLVAIRNDGSTCWLIDEDGDTWQTGGITTGAASCYINDTENVNMSIGLTINQGVNDNEILALKASEVAHGGDGSTETDTFGYFKKVAATSGGLSIVGLRDADGNNRGALQLIAALAENVDTTKSDTGRGLMELLGKQISGDAVADVVADGNVVAVRCRRGAADKTLWIVDEDGDTWQSGSLTLGSTALSEADLISLLALL